MSISIREVEHIASLAKLRFSEAEKEALVNELTAILEYMEKLEELDTGGVEPMSHPVSLSNVMRDDVVQPSLPVETALGNAPAKQKGFFKVPKVIK